MRLGKREKRRTNVEDRGPAGKTKQKTNKRNDSARGMIFMRGRKGAAGCRGRKSTVKEVPLLN